MKLFQQRKYYSDHERPLHAVERHGWVKGGYKRLLTIEARTFCGEVLLLEKEEELVEYEKDKHRKRICPACVAEVVARSKREKMLARSPSPSVR